MEQPRSSEYEPAAVTGQQTEYPGQATWNEDGSYRTGSTTPPRDHRGAIAVALVAVIFFGGILSLLSIMKVELFSTIGPEITDSPVSFSAEGDGAVPDGLEVWDSDDSFQSQDDNQFDSAQLQIEDSALSVENIPEEGALSWQQVYEKMIHSVVSITASSPTGSTSGTGVVMSADGYIITNAHVVDGAMNISVLLTDDRVFSAKVIGADTISDLAVLAVEATDLIPAEFGDSSVLRVGDAVVAIGDPLGVELRGSMTDGIISAIERDLQVGGRTMSLLQTTAALNSGNSGGPLVNCYGQVIGINTMKIGDNASYAGVEGLGFAIPSMAVKDVVEQLIANGYVSGRPTLSISGQEVSSFYQYYYRLPSGWLVTEVEPGSGADRAGLEAGDIILYANQQRISNEDELNLVINSHEVGQTMELIIYRHGKEYLVSVVLDEAKG